MIWHGFLWFVMAFGGLAWISKAFEGSSIISYQLSRDSSFTIAIVDLSCSLGGSEAENSFADDSESRCSSSEHSSTSNDEGLSEACRVDLCLL